MPVGLFRSFDLLPDARELLEVARRLYITPDMRVTPNQLLVEALKQVGHLELALVNGNLRMQQDLQKQVAHFLAERLRIVAIQRFKRFLRFFQQIGAQ